MPRGRRIGDSSSWPEDHAKEHHVNVFLFNLVLTAINSAAACIVFIWFVQSFYFADDSLGKAALLTLPIFYDLCFVLPFCCLWMWITFFKQPTSRQHFVPPAVLTIFEIVFGMTWAAMTWVILRGIQ